MLAAAEISGCGRYRYALSRSWGDQKKRVVFVMLNPSTADASADDPTIRKCIYLSHRWGFRAILVINLFAWRATDPRELKKVNDPEGPENERHWRDIFRDRRLNQNIVCAWGTKGVLRDQDLKFMRLAKHEGVKQLFALRVTKYGHPQHPLYLPHDTRIMPFGK